MKLTVNVDKCMLCGGCVAVCPPGNVLTLYETALEINQEKCTHCDSCVKICPMGALSLEE
jgi:ferredoxin